MARAKGISSGRLWKAAERLDALRAFHGSADTRLRRQRNALAASGRSACWALQTSRHACQQSNTDQQISFRNR
jgi:hypothetical protein